MKIVAVIPINGRSDILKITMPRLIKQVYKVILVGHYADQAIPDTDYYICDTKTKRGAKWQYAIDRARDYSPDAVLISSSGGVFKDEYFNYASGWLHVFDVIASAGLYYLDFQPNGNRMIYWPGYNGSRSSEPVGLGRIISRQFLNRCNWQLYPKDVQSGLDYRQMAIFTKYAAEINIIRDPELSPMRISSYKYVQTNSFDHLAKINNSQKIENIDSILNEFNLIL